MFNPEVDMKWKDRYEVIWCDLCETVSICCPDCNATSCNCMSCEKCHKDLQEFNDEVKTTYDEYLTEEECETIRKAHYIRGYMLSSIRHGEKKIDWKRMKREGKLCEHSEKLFEEELKGAIE